MKNIFDLGLYQFILFTFVLNRYRKDFLQFLQLISNNRLKSCRNKNSTVNDSKIIQGKLSKKNISTKSRKTKPDTIVMYVCGICKNPKSCNKTKQKWIIIKI